MALIERGKGQGKELVVTFWCICNLIPVKNEVSEANMAKWPSVDSWYVVHRCFTFCPFFG